jgi:hypothetical protein
MERWRNRRGKAVDTHYPYFLLVRRGVDAEAHSCKVLGNDQTVDSAVATVLVQWVSLKARS